MKENWQDILCHLTPIDQKRFLHYCRLLKIQEQLFLRRRMIPFQATLLAGLVIPLLFLLAACSPSPQTIQTAIAQTQAAWTPIPTDTKLIITSSETFPPILTSTPKFVPSKTPYLMPSATETSAQMAVYIMEDGFCLFDAGKVSGDPKNNSLCRMMRRNQVTLSSGEPAIVTASPSIVGQSEIYCALFSLDGNFLMSDIDIIGSNQVSCHYP